MAADELHAEDASELEPASEEPQEANLDAYSLPEQEEAPIPKPVGPSVEAPEEEPAQPSRTGRFFRLLLRWAVVFIVIFGLGVLATWFARVQPQQDDIDHLTAELEAAEDTIAQLTEEVNTLRPLVTENAELKEELATAELHIAILQVMNDVTSAQVALAQGDVVTAQAILSGTDERLEELESTLTGDQLDIVAGLHTRLALVVEEIEDDPFAASNDLEVLSNTLNALERSLFGS
ncbi:MAG: hypothetical protein GTO18_15780 [Anaerolineales bacterium]|nr:hypothetical protein [Anaerolineales bacterium]